MTLEGPTTVYSDVGDTGEGVKRFFCPTCGTPIESQSSYSYPRYAVIKAGTFDDPGGFVPKTEVYCASAMPWVLSGERRVRYDTVIADIDESAEA